MKVAIVGYGIENQAVLHYWQQKGAEITVCDQNTSVEIPDGVASQLGDSYLDNLDNFDVIVRTVGMSPAIILDKNPDVRDKITTAINIFFEECKTPIIGVTGTKGKGTTSTLIAKILEASGKKAVLAGNIGIPVMEVLEQSHLADYVVVELSSFQLIDLRYSPHIAVCLMVAPEHLDWHPGMDDYIAAKQQMFKNQKPEDVVVYNRASEHSADVANVSPATHKVTYEVPGLGAQPTSRDGVYVSDDKIFVGQVPVCNTDEVALLGRHNLENICAAIAATWEITQHNSDAVKSVVSSFKGLEHRLEFVKELDGVKYYDDSFGTTPETATVAIQAFPNPKVVILGGSSKNVEFDGLAQVVTSHNVKSVVLIGETGPAIEKALQATGFKNIVQGGGNMTRIVNTARSQATNGDVVLLSTACASFDMFKNYKDRGEQFKQSVQALV